MLTKKNLSEAHFPIQGESYAIFDATNLGEEFDYDGTCLINDLYNYTLDTCPVMIHNNIVTKEWFPTAASEELSEWFISALINYLQNNENVSYLRNVLTPKEYSDLFYLIKSNAQEGQYQRLAHTLANTYTGELNNWHKDTHLIPSIKQINEGASEVVTEEINSKYLAYKIGKNKVVFVSGGEEVAEFSLGSLSNMSEKDLFDELYSVAIENVPNVDFIAIVDFMLALRTDIGKATGVIPLEEPVGETIEEAVLAEDDPQNVQGFDVLGDRVNQQNIRAEHRFDSFQSANMKEFNSADGEYEVVKGEKYNTPDADPLDAKIEELIDEANEEVIEITVQKITDFGELSDIPIGETDTSIMDMATYEVNNPYISSLNFYLTVDIVDDSCIVNIISHEGETMTELTKQLIDYALTTQLDAEGKWVPHDPDADDEEEEAGEAEPVEEANNISDAAGDISQDNLNIEPLYGDVSEVETVGVAPIDTSDPELAFDLKIEENDDGSMVVIGNIPTVINALVGNQAEALKKDLLEEPDEFDMENNPTVLS